jgi:2-methylcitrate dehydratase
MARIAKPGAPKQQTETCSAVERIGAFAAGARPQHLTTDIQQLFKRNILDSIGCAIAAAAGPALRLLRDQIEEYRAPGRCTLIGGGRTSPDQAALFNSALVRYVDLLDSYMADGGLCHPSDNFGTILAADEYAGASGEDFMLALATAYEIQCRFTARVPVMAKGFNHAIQLAISAAAGAGRLFGLSVNELANAIAIATVDNISLTCVHAEPVSPWKGFSPGITGMRAVYSASLAKRGFTGPKGLFEGPGRADLVPMWAGQSANLSTCTDVPALLTSLVEEVSGMARPIMQWSPTRREKRILKTQILNKEKKKCQISPAKL